MIRLNENYAIDVTDTSYNLVKIRISTGEKTKGEEKSSPIGYFRSLEGALNYFRREIIKDKLKSRSMGLPEALNVIKEEDSRIEKMIKAAVKEF